MSVSLYQASVPVFQRGLAALIGVLDKAEAHAAERKFDANNFLGLRLAPDQFPLTRQVQIACDHAKNASHRLAGLQAPVIEDKETTLGELRDRIRKTLDLLKTVDAAAIDGSEEREIVFPVGPNKIKMQGANYLLHFATPNFYFHMTTAYDILRAAGVAVGKLDYLGDVPGWTRV